MESQEGKGNNVPNPDAAPLVRWGNVNAMDGQWRLHDWQSIVTSLNTQQRIGKSISSQVLEGLKGFEAPY